MRYLIPLFFVACGMDYEIEPQCDEVDGYLVCAREVDYFEAEAICDATGRILVELDGLEEQDRVSLLGEHVFGETAWWGGLSTMGYECRGMSGLGGTGSLDCGRLLPFVCEIPTH